MADERDLDWDGCINVRDLGGLATVDGGRTRFGAVVRSDHPRYLTVAGWTALWDYGIRTVVTLETENVPPEKANEANTDIDVRDHHPALAQIRIGIEDGADREFMARWADNDLWTTPLYYADALARWPQRHARLVRAVTHAKPGGVLVHCGRGCDRTGIASLLLLALAGVAAEDIAEDYARSGRRLAAREPDYQRWLTTTLAERDTCVRDAVTAVMSTLEPRSYLRRGGLTDEEIDLARARLTTA